MDEKPKILIVEDERIIALETRYKLESMGYDVPAIVSSGEEAIKKAEELHPDLVLMDIILQGEMDGVETAGQIRTRFDIPVVYVTANVSDARLEDITRTEPFGCLFKPFEDMELHAAVEMALYRYKMEKELRESGEKLRKEMNFTKTFIQASPAFFVAIRADGETIMMNESMLHALGYTANEVVGKDYITSFVHEKDQEVFSKVFEKLTKLHEPTLNENRVLTRDGRELLVEWHGRPVFNEHGEFEYFFGTGIDITDRRQAEKALRDSEKKYRTLAETTKDATFVLDLDEKCTYVSPVIEKLTGYSWQDFLGHSFAEFIAPEYVKSTVERFKEGLAGKYISLYEIEMKHKDGGTVPIELNVTSLPDATGKTTGRIGVARDITERKKVEETLRKSEREKSAILDSMAEPVLHIDADMKILSTNRAMSKLFNLPLDKMKGRICYEVLHNRNKLCGACSMAEVFETGKPRESDVVSSFGKKWILGSYPVSYEGGKVASAIEIAHDITTIMQAEAEIKSHQEHITLINQILRHDLTNDLVVIQSALNLYNKSPEEDLLQEISSHTKKSLGLINRMRELEFFISRHSNLKPHKVNDIIDEVIKNYPFIDFKTKGRGLVMADDSLPSVIDNIVRNAVIHGKADKITITTGRERDMREVRIADNGTGIPDEIKAKVFEEGFIHGDTGHTGLGLHIVEKAMENYGGYAYVEDNAPKGAVFVLRFRMVK
ncbi:MAG: PAS domain S-box protein [Deltaproteobacteria bacterium]|nr:PAS domain S-box protein [Deltaproteobacteria bacterium]